MRNRVAKEICCGKGYEEKIVVSEWPWDIVSTKKN